MHKWVSLTAFDLAHFIVDDLPLNEIPFYYNTACGLTLESHKFSGDLRKPYCHDCLRSGTVPSAFKAA